MRLFLILWTLTLAHTVLAVTPEVELHFALCDNSMESIFEKLGAGDLEAKDRTVSYADTKQHDYYSRGLTVRRRERAKKGGETVVKIKIASVNTIDRKWFALDDFKCEYDRSRDSVNLNCSLESSDDSLSQDQIDFIEAYGPQDFSTDSLKSYGPAQDTTWKNYETEEGLSLDFERYTFPNGDQILEVSSRVEQGAQDQAFGQLQRLLTEHGVALCTDQSSKTKSFFAHF